MNKQLTTKSFGEYSALAHATMRLCDKALPKNGAALLYLFARAKGFDSSQAFKKAFEDDKQWSDAISAAMRINPEPEMLVTTAYHGALLRFFEVGPVAASIGEIIYQIISGEGRFSHYGTSYGVSQEKLDHKYANELLRSPATQNLYDTVVGVYGDVSYQTLCMTARDFPAKSYSFIAAEVQREAWRHGFCVMLHSTLIELDLRLQSKSFRKNVRAEMEGSKDPFASKSFSDCVRELIFAQKFERPKSQALADQGDD